MEAKRTDALPRPIRAADELRALDTAIASAGREGVHITEAKNNTDHMVVLTADIMPKTLRGLRAWLRMLGALSPTTPLLRSNRGTRVSYDTVHYNRAKVCAAAELTDVLDGKEQPRYTIHQLWHTVGSTLIIQYPE